MQVQIAAKSPTLVYVAGLLLNPNSYKIEMSKIKPTNCTVRIFKNPHLPKRVLEILEEKERDKNAEIPELWIRIVASIGYPLGNGSSIPIQIELDCTAIEYMTTAQPPVEATSSAAS